MLYKNLHNLPEPLLEDIVEGRCIPILGAGFSMNASLPKGYKMPLWNDLADCFIKQMKDYPSNTNPLDAISAFCHEYSRAKMIEQLRNFLNVDRANPGNAHLAFADLPFDTILTTNFDFLLERSYDIKRKPYCPIVDENQLTVSITKGVTRLMKIHGDLNHPSNLIATEEDYDTYIEKNPLLCTYISNLLISRTPVFIGYSFEDPDFRSLWQIIGARLGNLRRNAYTFAVEAKSSDIAKYERRGVKVINLDGKKAEYGEVFKDLFEELREYWLDKTAEKSTTSSEESLFELSLPRDSHTRLCMFSIPYELLSYYRSNIFPIFEKRGLTPITASDIIAPGDSIIAKISLLIDRSYLFVADVSSSIGISELNLALNKGKQVIIIKEKGNNFMMNSVSNLKIFDRPTNLNLKDTDQFVIELEGYISSLAKDRDHYFDEEPRRLLEKNEYKAAVIAVISLLEMELRQMIEAPSGAYSMRKLIALAVQNHYISQDKMQQIMEWIYKRNELVHTKGTIAQNMAKNIVNEVLEVIDKLKTNKNNGAKPNLPTLLIQPTT